MARGSRYRRPIHTGQFLAVCVEDDLPGQKIEPVFVEISRGVERQVYSSEVVSVRSVEAGIVRFRRLQDKVDGKAPVVLVILSREEFYVDLLRVAEVL